MPELLSSPHRCNQSRDNLTQWQETIQLNLPCLLSVAAWPAERAAYGATQIWVASGYLHHKSLGVPPQSWRHVDHSRWTLGPASCQLMVQLPLLPPTAMDILFAQVPVLHWRPMLGSPSLLLLPWVYPASSVLLHSCCPSAAALYLPPSDFCFLRFFSLFGEERECVCASFSPRHIQCVLHSLPPPSLHLTLRSPSIPLCTHCKCGIWEYGPHDTDSFIPSCKCVHNGHGNIGKDWHAQRILSWYLLGFLFLQRDQKQNLLVGWKTHSFPSSVVCLLYCFGQSNGHLVSAKTVVFFMFVCFMFVSVT